mmetsp:Transcript_531/g.1270  ORF Transcript_531/g.1270 Transcript_531/m.1270 type:complete len:123 (-) Transcript_531:698-1066(-)
MFVGSHQDDETGEPIVNYLNLVDDPNPVYNFTDMIERGEKAYEMIDEAKASYLESQAARLENRRIVKERREQIDRRRREILNRSEAPLQDFYEAGKYDDENQPLSSTDNESHNTDDDFSSTL